MLTNKSMQPGFSFIEMMVALLIMGIMAGLIGPRVMGLLTKGKQTATTNTLKIVKQSIKQYKMEVGTYPNSLQDLIKKPENISGWHGPYVGDEDKANPEVPLDGWNQDLVYKRNAQGTTPPFELYSTGDPDKEEDKIEAP